MGRKIRACTPIKAKTIILVQKNGESDLDWLDTAAWADTRIDIDRLAIKPGVRVEHYGLTGEDVIDPRLSLSLSLTETLTLRETLGRYHQPPTPGDVDPNGGPRIARLGRRLSR